MDATRRPSRATSDIPRPASAGSQHRGKRERWSSTPRTSTSAWRGVVDDLQPNQRAWLSRASRSRCTRAPPSSRCPTTSPATSSRAGCVPSSRTRSAARFGREIRLARHGQPRTSRTEPTPRTEPTTADSSRQIDLSTNRTSRHVEPGDRPFASPASRQPRRRSAPRPQPARDPAQPEVHLRDLRHRLLQPVPPRRRRRRRRGAGQGLQPAARLRRLRPGQDPPAARDRPLRPHPLHRRPGALRVQRGVHQRVHQRDPRRPAGPVQAPVPRRRRAADRRHPVPGGQDPDPGGVLPHLQHAAQRQQADRAHLRPARPSGSRRSRTGCATGSSGA